MFTLSERIHETIRARQERNYPTRVSGTTMQNPDFAMLAGAYGSYAERVETLADFAAACERVFGSKTGALLDLNISPEALTPSQMEAA